MILVIKNHEFLAKKIYIVRLADTPIKYYRMH